MQPNNRSIHSRISLNHRQTIGKFEERIDIESLVDLNIENGEELTPADLEFFSEEI